MKLAYCDMIAYAIKENIENNTTGWIKFNSINWDLAKEGYMQSTKKFVTLTDANGKSYKVTVEEMIDA